MNTMDLVFIEHQLVNLSKCLSLFILVFSSYIAAIFFYYRLFRRKSLEELYNELSFKKTPEGQISVIKYIHYYFQEYTLVELVLYNLKYKGIKYFPYLHYFVPVSFAAFFFSASMFANVSYKSHLVDISVYSYILWPVLFILVDLNQQKAIYFNTLNTPMTSTDFKVTREYAFKVTREYAFKLTKLVIDVVCISCFSAIICILFIYTSEFFFFGQKEIFNIIPSNYINFYTNFPFLFNYISKFKIESGNQLSLAGFYFSLAVGGTVVLSIIDRYFEESNSLREKLLAQVNVFNDLYSENNLSLSLDLSGIISFDLKSIKFGRFNIKNIIDFKKENIKNFADTLSIFRARLECADVVHKNILLKLYKRFIYLTAITYAIGIVTIFIPEQFIIYLLWIFIIDSALVGALIYLIYTNYRK